MLNEALQQFVQGVQRTIDTAIPALQSVYEAVYQAYRDTGMPYGDSHEGFMHWVEDMGKIKRLEGEIELILQRHSTLVSARRLGESIRKKKEELGDG